MSNNVCVECCETTVTMECPKCKMWLCHECASIIYDNICTYCAPILRKIKRG